MDNKRTIPAWLNTTLLICLTAIIVYNVATIVMNKSTWGVNLNYVSLLNIFACTPAIYYCLSGYKKNASVSYLVFCAIYAITELLKLLVRGTLGSPILLLPSVIVFGCMCVFCIGKNLGKKKSYILAGIVVGLGVIDLIYVSIYSTENVILIIQNLILRICFFTMVYAKYVDKEERGTN